MCLWLVWGRRQTTWNLTVPDMYFLQKFCATIPPPIYAIVHGAVSCKGYFALALVFSSRALSFRLPCFGSSNFWKFIFHKVVQRQCDTFWAWWSLWWLFYRKFSRECASEGIMKIRWELTKLSIWAWCTNFLEHGVYAQVKFSLLLAQFVFSCFAYFTITVTILWAALAQ